MQRKLQHISRKQFQTDTNRRNATAFFTQPLLVPLCTQWLQPSDWRWSNRPQGRPASTTAHPEPPHRSALPVCLSACLPVCLSAHLRVCASACLCQGEGYYSTDGPSPRTPPQYPPNAAPPFLQYPPLWPKTPPHISISHPSQSRGIAPFSTMFFFIGYKL